MIFYAELFSSNITPEKKKKENCANSLMHEVMNHLGFLTFLFSSNMTTTENEKKGFLTIDEWHNGEEGE